jgi:hypothetical protein
MLKGIGILNICSAIALVLYMWVTQVDGLLILLMAANIIAGIVSFGMHYRDQNNEE